MSVPRFWQILSQKIIRGPIWVACLEFFNGTVPGGDSQDQLTLQFFLNYVEFGMNIQEALDAPAVRSVHFPSSFYPRAAFPGRLITEPMIAGEVIAELSRRGHEIEMTDAWYGGKVLAIHYDKSTGVISGGASPRGTIGYAFGW